VKQLILGILLASFFAMLPQRLREHDMLSNYPYAGLYVTGALILVVLFSTPLAKLFRRLFRRLFPPATKGIPDTPKDTTVVNIVIGTVDLVDMPSEQVKALLSKAKTFAKSGGTGDAGTTKD